MISDKKAKDLVKNMATYKFTSSYVLYYDGKAHVFNVGDLINLAGLELSKNSTNSPCHFKNDIVRIPNSVIEKI
mgnify:CR=1 FL=1